MGEQEQDEGRDGQDDRFLDRRALIAICATGIVGFLIILIYGLQATSFQSFASIAGFGMAMAGASLLLGGLVGLLFGIPRSLQQEHAEPAKKNAKSEEEEREDTRSRALYGANTNLEQISDWLTKILVGVGLTQIGKIGEVLGDIGDVASEGMGGFVGSKPFSIAMTVYFTISGFLLGYLWTRLYLGRALTAAERTQSLKKRLDKFEQDARALRLAEQQLFGDDTKLPAQAELDAAMKTASSVALSHIFYRAADQRTRNWEDDKPMMERTIPIFRFLAASDVRRQFHRNYGQLGYALKDQRKPDWVAAEQALSTAIRIRGESKDGAWLAYEYNRAICRIALDQAFGQDKPSPKEAKSGIVADIKMAIEDEWILTWAETEPIVTKWLKINKLTLNHLK
jgi:hypothetical protein